MGCYVVDSLGLSYGANALKWKVLLKKVIRARKQWYEYGQEGGAFAWLNLIPNLTHATYYPPPEPRQLQPYNVQGDSCLIPVNFVQFNGLLSIFRSFKQSIIGIVQKTVLRFLCSSWSLRTPDSKKSFLPNVRPGVFKQTAYWLLHKLKG